jgi:non-ribosomal peptide synthetase component F
MDIRRVDRRLLCTFICNSDLFQEGTVARLARQYQELLETVARDADSRVTLCGKPSQDLGAAPSDLAELEDMSDEEAERLLAGELRSGGK